MRGSSVICVNLHPDDVVCGGVIAWVLRRVGISPAKTPHGLANPAIERLELLDTMALAELRRQDHAIEIVLEALRLSTSALHQVVTIEVLANVSVTQEPVNGIVVPRVVAPRIGECRRWLDHVNSFVQRVCPLH